MKKDFTNLIKIITLGVLVCASAGYLLALNYNPPACPAPSCNVATPLNISGTPQVRQPGGGGSADGALLNIKGLLTGLLTSNSMAIFNNAVFGGNLLVSSMTGTGQKALCSIANPSTGVYDGTIGYCPTVALPTLGATTAITNIGPSSAMSGGNISSDGGGTVIERGVAWSSMNNFPTIADKHSNDGTGTGTFTSNLTGLTSNLNYWARSYATNSAGTAYGTTTLYFATSATPFILHVGKAGTGALGGTITASVGGINCGATCDATLSAPATVTFSESGLGFTNWTGVTCNGGNNALSTCTVTVSSATTATATFLSCSGTLVNGYCWYQQASQSGQSSPQNCHDYCSSISKNCVETSQTCAQDKATLSLLGVSCGSYEYNQGYNNAYPDISGSMCGVRTNVPWSCGSGSVSTSHCYSTVPWRTELCACDN